MQTSGMVKFIAEMLQVLFRNRKNSNDSNTLGKNPKNSLKPQECAVFMLSQGWAADFKDLHNGTRCVSRRP